jgi:hypothetical protein
MDSEGHFVPLKTVQASKTETAGTSAITVPPDDGNDGIASVTVNPTPSETKSQVAGTSNIDVTPTSGKLLSKVTITPQQHSETFNATSRSSALDMGILHNYRYIDTLGIPLPPIVFAKTSRITSSAASSWPHDIVVSGKKYYVVQITKADAWAFCNSDSYGTSTLLTDNTFTYAGGPNDPSGEVQITTWLLEAKSAHLHMNYKTDDDTAKEGLWTYIIFGPID